MHMGIDEGWREQPTTKINFGLLRRCPPGRVIAADEPDQISVGHDSRRPWIVRSVDASPDEDHKVSPNWAFGQIWGRSSKGIERTVVVSVDTLAAARMRASVDSRCPIVGAWTLSR